MLVVSSRSHLNLPVIEPDHAIRDYLTGKNMTEKESGRFFHAVFKTIGSVLEEKEAEIYKACTGTSKVDSMQRFATWWADHLSVHGTQEGIYKRILDEINGTVCIMKTHSAPTQFSPEPAACEGNL